MQLNISIDDMLLQQATHITGLTDQQALLEAALRSLIQTQLSHQHRTDKQRQQALEHLAAMQIDWQGQPIVDRDALYDDVRGS